jgi:hypothetical protein
MPVGGRRLIAGGSASRVASGYAGVSLPMRRWSLAGDDAGDQHVVAERGAGQAGERPRHLRVQIRTSSPGGGLG